MWDVISFRLFDVILEYISHSLVVLHDTVLTGLHSFLYHFNGICKHDSAWDEGTCSTRNVPTFFRSKKTNFRTYSVILRSSSTINKLMIYSSDYPVEHRLGKLKVGSNTPLDLSSVTSHHPTLYQFAPLCWYINRHYPPSTLEIMIVSSHCHCCCHSLGSNLPDAYRLWKKRKIPTFYIT